ncbi:Signal transduction histidine kinase [Parasphingorhabdus marina DSM 22363]|uniref:histidine kinase n=1 Tax=Parasphingorhabdus marina DSM 22363 TaxID=1123272 RepID=A0A1N6DBM8_9SPHN|nr:sensor histidine kinase [Parasphingorhabdus marina]SIN68200.1 Signal transduction histidine kinase [Parasphingorhabdus marina DSM 22363]
MITRSFCPNHSQLFLLVALLLSVVALSFSAPVMAQAEAEAGQTDPVPLPQGNNHLQPFGSLRYLISDADTLDPEKAIARREEFRALESPWVDFGEQEGSVWLLVAIENASERGGRWIIDIQRPFVDELIVQKRGPGKPVETLLDVDRETHFDERPIISQYLVAPLWMEAGERAEILVGLRSSTGSWIPLTFATEERMRTAHMQEARTNWILNGIMVALVIIALAMGRLAGWPLVMAFAAYASFSALFVANNEGYLHRFFWPGSMGTYEPANLLLLSVMMIALLQFARLFADLGKHFARLNRAVIGLQLLLCILAVSSLFFWQLAAMRWAVYLFVPLVAIAYLTIAVSAWRARVLGAIPFLAGSVAILFTVVTMAAVLLSPGQFPLTVALDYFHAAVILEGLAFLVAILVRMLSIQAELNRSLAAEVSATQEKLALSEALQDSRNRYDAARDLADGLRSQLVSTSHDLQQPLLALRHSLAKVTGRNPEEDERLKAALDYLENVTETGLDIARSDNILPGEKPEQGMEVFAISLVLSNCAAMFAADAEQRGVELRVRSSDLMVRTEPIDLVRSLSNLVANALNHANANKVLVAVQKRSDHVLLRVIDNGQGMEQSDAEAMQAANVKGPASDGHGLGLYLVQQYAGLADHAFEIRSTSGRGTCVTLKIPVD